MSREALGALLDANEPPRVCRRLGSLSQAASATSCWLA